MTASETTGGDERVASSPRSSIKFLCSYGGKILPRPGDAKLKYVGGETRVVAVPPPPDIKFSELMKKLNAMAEGDMIMKYQVIPEDLDALVTVKSDEDLKHMVDEYHRLESGGGSPKLRVFLFPSSQVVVNNQMNHVDPFAIEQRYTGAVNGIVRRSSSSGRLTPVNPNSQAYFSNISSCSSSKSASPDHGCHQNRSTIPKVQSSPSLYSLSTLYAQSNNHSNHQVYHPHHQQLPPYSFQSPKPSLDFRNEKPPGPYDFGRGPMGHGHVPVDHVYSIGRRTLGNGYSRCGCCYEGCLVYACGRIFRRRSLPPGGRLDKPDKFHEPYVGVKQWDQMQ